MAHISFKNTDEYIRKLQKLADKSTHIVKEALYEGAGFMADKIRQQITELPNEEYRYAYKYKPLYGITKEQKEGLLNGLGISKMEDKMGAYNVSISFDGYNATKTKKYPNGQPNLLIARSIESGTSFRQKHPFVRIAVSENKKEVLRIMQKVIDDEVNKIIK